MKTEIEVLKEKVLHYTGTAKYWRDKFLKLDKKPKIMETYAILKPEETVTAFCKHETLYKFYYDTTENFFIVINGVSVEETSTAFNFLTVQP